MGRYKASKKNVREWRLLSNILYIPFSGYHRTFYGGLKLNQEFLVLHETRGQQAMACGMFS